MSYEHKEGFGALFKSDKKGNEKAPDYKGTIMAGGLVYDLAGWIKQGSKGNFLSVSAKVKEQEKPTENAPKPERKEYPAGKAFDDFDSDLPF